MVGGLKSKKKALPEGTYLPARQPQFHMFDVFAASNGGKWPTPTQRKSLDGSLVLCVNDGFLGHVLTCVL